MTAIEEKLPFLKPGFFSWTGTTPNSAPEYHQISKLSDVIFLIGVILVFITCLLLWVFKRQIYVSYQNNKLSPLTKNILIRTAGIFTIFFICVRSGLLLSSNFQRMWEAIPFHYCRLMCLAIGFLLLFNRLEYIKYFGFFSIIGGIVALSLPDLKYIYTITNGDLKQMEVENFIQVDPNNHREFFMVYGQKVWIGDNFFKVNFNNLFFWDFYLIHAFVILSPIVIMIIFPMKYRLRTSVISFVIIFTTFLFMYCLNWILDITAPIQWQSNYFYAGLDTVNKIYSKKLGVFTKHPWHFFTYIFFGALFLAISNIFYLYQDNVLFEFSKGKMKVKIIKGENLKYFKEHLSWSEFNIFKNH